MLNRYFPTLEMLLNSKFKVQKAGLFPCEFKLSPNVHKNLRDDIKGKTLSSNDNVGNVKSLAGIPIVVVDTMEENEFAIVDKNFNVLYKGKFEGDAENVS